jgi:hypothetical protein
MIGRRTPTSSWPGRSSSWCCCTFRVPFGTASSGATASCSGCSPWGRQPGADPVGAKGQDPAGSGTGGHGLSRCRRWLPGPLRTPACLPAATASPGCCTGPSPPWLALAPATGSSSPARMLSPSAVNGHRSGVARPIRTARGQHPAACRSCSARCCSSRNILDHPGRFDSSGTGIASIHKEFGIPTRTPQRLMLQAGDREGPCVVMAPTPGLNVLVTVCW